MCDLVHVTLQPCGVLWNLIQWYKDKSAVNSTLDPNHSCPAADSNSCRIHLIHKIWFVPLHLSVGIGHLDWVRPVIPSSSSPVTSIPKGFTPLEAWWPFPQCGSTPIRLGFCVFGLLFHKVPWWHGWFPWPDPWICLRHLCWWLPPDRKRRPCHKSPGPLSQNRQCAQLRDLCNSG